MKWKRINAEEYIKLLGEETVRKVTSPLYVRYYRQDSQNTRRGNKND
ncbi:hypothetical protein LCGC14_1990880 [marine sediment metagenome]|uniref:Uncharacterized protein n=1 Tax=marine sediment metagenome TaxID=412755 RepID=A0A0F9I387_9ZZZZ